MCAQSSLQNSPPNLDTHSSQHTAHRSHVTARYSRRGALPPRSSPCARLAQQPRQCPVTHPSHTVRRRQRLFSNSIPHLLCSRHAPERGSRAPPLLPIPPRPAPPCARALTRPPFYSHAASATSARPHAPSSVPPPQITSAPPPASKGSWCSPTRSAPLRAFTASPRLSPHANPRPMGSQHAWRGCSVQRRCPPAPSRRPLPPPLTRQPCVQSWRAGGAAAARRRRSRAGPGWRRSSRPRGS